MSVEQAKLLAILLVAGILFVSGRVRVDLVALLVIVALMLTGVSSPAEAVAGFGSTVVVMIGSLLVVGEALARTGVAVVVGDAILRLSGGHEGRTRTLLVLASALLGSVMSSTAVVALFLPVVMRIAQEQQLAPGRLLLPLAYGALISGMMTLIGTAPNLVVHAELRTAGHAGFAFFDFTPTGIAVLIALLGLLWLGSAWLLPPQQAAVAFPSRPRVRELWQRFVPRRQLQRYSVGPHSALAGQSPREVELGSRHGVRIVAIEREAGRRAAVLEPTPDQRFAVGDVLVVTGTEEHLASFAGSFALDQLPDAFDGGAFDRSLGVAVVMIHPESKLVGSTLAKIGFRSQHRLHVAGVQRDGQPLPDFARVPLRPADLLLVMGPWSRIRSLGGELHDFVLLTMPAELATIAPARRRMPVALAILGALVIVMATGLLPVVTAALLAAVAMVVARCVSLTEVYQTIHWGSLVLIAGMLPLATALDRTGVLHWAVEGLQAVLPDAGPRTLLAMLFLTSAVVGSFVSNTATAVLMAPIALRVAEAAQVRPEAMAMAVAIACSSAFLTPMGSPVVSLVVEPGSYRGVDLLRAGTPLFLITLSFCVAALPWQFPF